MKREELARVIGAWLTETGRWMPGMRLDDGARIIACNEYERETGYPSWIEPDSSNYQRLRTAAWSRTKARVPDLDDPATVGCLLALLWEKQKPEDREIQFYPEEDYAQGAEGWYARTSGCEWGPCATPGEAVARALVVSYEIGGEPTTTVGALAPTTGPRFGAAGGK